MQVSAGQDGAPDPQQGSDGLASFVEQLVAEAGLQTNLQGCVVQREQIPRLAEAASAQWIGGFNSEVLSPSPGNADAVEAAKIGRRGVST